MAVLQTNHGRFQSKPDLHSPGLKNDHTTMNNYNQ